MFIAYILACSDGTYHLGITNNLEARVAYHVDGKNANAYTFARRPVQLVFQKSFSDIRQAIAYDAELQTKSEQEVAQIISGKLAVKIESIAPIETTETARKPIILPVSYLGNLAYFSKVNTHQEVLLDVNERFQKQSYRSRCTINSANGLQNLVVPLIRPNGKESLLHEILISYTHDWLKDHIKAIESAYRRAPYFEFYGEELIAVLQKKHKRLIHLNLELTTFFITSFGIDATVRFADLGEESSIALKNEMLPKARENYQVKPYRQVFDNGSFENNLSVIDLLFNCGKDGVNLIG
ncbi:MAG: hypothetical protein GQ574_10580 [Crocinitomix sp.]|nr:hypothetical protein [Crocinitomix sp.]